MKKKNPETINEYLNDKYGKQGEESRSEFLLKAHFFIVVELVKDARKRLILLKNNWLKRYISNAPYL